MVLVGKAIDGEGPELIAPPVPHLAMVEVAGEADTFGSDEEK